MLTGLIALCKLHLALAKKLDALVCLIGIRPYFLEPVVELCRTKIAVCELHRGAITWFLQLLMLKNDIVEAINAFSKQKWVK